MMTSVPFKRILIFLFVASMAYLSWWLNTRTTAEKITLDTSARHDPDYYADKLSVLSLDENGRPEFRLNVRQLFHFPDDNTAELKHPEITVYQDNKVSWRIRSDNGLVSADGKQLDLEHRVVVKQESVESGPTLMTERLTIMPDNKTVQTSAHVVVQDASVKTEATGMTADLADNRLQLLSGVRGVYENP